MTPAAFLALATLAAALVAALEAARRIWQWRIGKPAPVPLSGLLALPRRYLVDVHDVVARDPFAARMHALVAGGFLAGGLFTALAAVPPLGGSRLYWLLPAAAFAVMLAGAAMVRRRRMPVRPARLSGGRFTVLPWLFAAFGVGGLIVSVTTVLGGLEAIGWIGAVLATAGAAGLALQVHSGPLRHIVAGAIHLVAHPRPARFAGVRDTALAPLDLSADRLGIAVPADFTWNRLAGFDACIQCGRCEAACPAFAAGQPLNPKKLIQDLSAAIAPGGSDEGYAGSPAPGLPVGTRHGGPHLPLVGAIVPAETIWSCTTCRACVEECPMMIEHVDAIVGMRRFETLDKGAVPGKGADVLAELRLADDPGGRPLSARADFAAGLTLPMLAAGGATDVLLWLGEGAYDLRTGRTLRALVRLLQAAGVEFAVLGADERDCGDLARRLGDEATFQRLAADNIAALSARRFARILTADPHAFHVLKNEYPAFGGRFDVVHHTTFLAQLVAAGRLRPAALSGPAITYHDPCYLGRYNGETAAPRALLDALGLERREMARSGLKAMCCGGGGGAPVTDIPGERRIADLRMAQVGETGAATVAVACPGCTAMLEGVTGPRPEVKDVAELLWEAVEAAPARPAAGGAPLADGTAARRPEPVA
jgi:Fe-S oxidoreductase